MGKSTRVSLCRISHHSDTRNHDRHLYWSYNSGHFWSHKE